MRKIFGIIALFLGLVGTVACIAGIGGLWYVQSSVQTSVGSVAQVTEEYLDSTREKIKALEQYVNDGNDKIRNWRQTIADLSAKGTDRQWTPANRMKLAQLLDKVSLWVQKADRPLVVLEEKLENLRQILELAKSSRFYPVNSDFLDSKEIATLKAALKNFESTTNDLGELEKSLNRLGDKTDLQQVLTRVDSVIDNFETVMNLSNAGIEKINDSITASKENVSQLRESVSFWSLIVASVVTVLLVWIGVGQYCLMSNGWTMINSKKVE